MWGSLISVKIPFSIEPLKCNFYGFLYDFIKKRTLKGLILNFRSKRRYLKDIRRIRAKTRQSRVNYGRWWFFMSKLPSAWPCSTLPAYTAVQGVVLTLKKWPECRKMLLQFYTGILHGRVGGCAELENMTRSEKRGFSFLHGAEHGHVGGCVEPLLPPAL